MTDALVTLLATGCSVLGSIITTYITRNAQKENDKINARRENRITLYKELYQRIEWLRMNRGLVFDEWYEKYLMKCLPDIKLFASGNVIEAFMALGQFVHVKRSDYRLYYEKNDPRRDPDFGGENGVPVYLPEELELSFETQMQEYKKKQTPDAATINAMVSALRDAMRDDLGVTEDL